jgi:hypothetical protein
MRVCEVKYRIEYFNKPPQNVYIYLESARLKKFNITTKK